MPVKIRLGDLVELKKPHPCGNMQWEITRTGADIRMKCLRCQRQVLIPRVKFEKSLKRIIGREEELG